MLPGSSVPPSHQSGEILSGIDPSIRIEHHQEGKHLVYHISTGLLFCSVKGRYSTEELSMAVATSCVSALILGFVAGFLLARKCQCGSDNPYHVPYLNRSVIMNKLNSMVESKHQLLIQEEKF